MKLRTAIAMLFFTLAPAASVGAATSTEVRAAGTQLRIRSIGESGTTGNNNNVVLRFEAPGAIVVTGGPGLFPAGASCTSRSSTEVVCEAPFASIDITLGNGDDGVDLTQLTDKGMVPTTVDGGNGRDVLTGGPGPDVLNGDGRNADGSTVAAGAPPNRGDDLLIGNGGNDTLLGSLGNDALVSASVLGGGGEQNVLDGGPGNDLFDLGRGLGADEVRGGETEEGGSSTHPYKQSLGLTEATGLGDTVTYERRTFPAAGTAGVTADMDSNADDGAVGEGDLIGGAEHLVGSVRDDHLSGSTEKNRIVGLLGRDKVVAGAGDDFVNIRDGVQDECPSAGTGTNTIDADLTDEATYDDCVVNAPSSKTGTTTFTPADDPTVPARVGRRLRLAARAVVVRLRCPRSPQARCRGAVGVLGVERDYAIRKGRSAKVRIPLSRKARRKLSRAGSATVAITERGPSEKGPKEVRAKRPVTG